VQDGSSQTMGSKKDLTEGQRGSIIYGYLRKDSVRAIAAAVGCGRSSVYNVIKKFRESSTLAPQKIVLDALESSPPSIVLISRV
jgi:transposase-like protein